MDWTDEAEDAVKKVPFFVRKRVRARVEDQARAAGRKVVSLRNVKTARARFLAKMGETVKGYRHSLPGNWEDTPGSPESFPAFIQKRKFLQL
jgi:hypothetical protein